MTFPFHYSEFDTCTDDRCLLASAAAAAKVEWLWTLRYSYPAEAACKRSLDPLPGAGKTFKTVAGCTC